MKALKLIYRLSAIRYNYKEPLSIASLDKETEPTEEEILKFLEHVNTKYDAEKDFRTEIKVDKIYKVINA